MFRFLPLAFVLGLAAAPASAQQSHELGFRRFLMSVRQEAVNSGIHASTVDAVLGHANFEYDVIRLDRKQPESTRTLDQYLATIVTPQRVKQAREMIGAHRAQLTEIGLRYRVDPEVVVALWSIESNFGRNMGNFDVVDSLATLAYEGRRHALFRKELLDALRILDEGHLRRTQLIGSWAGAMGQTQFMPSTYRRYAVDYDRDGMRDIWATRVDVFASIANYISQLGWQYRGPWGHRASVPPGFERTRAGSRVQKTLAEWHALGVKPLGVSKGLPSGTVCAVVFPGDDAKRAYVVYPNYLTILKWNHSLYFATAVMTLADRLR